MTKAKALINITSRVSERVHKIIGGGYVVKANKLGNVRLLYWAEPKGPHF